MAGVNPGRLGDLAVKNSLVSEAQLSQCLAIQADLDGAGYRLALGQLLVGKYYLETPALGALLKAQARIRHDQAPPGPVDAFWLGTADQKLLAERIAAKGVLSPHEIERCRGLAERLVGHGIDRDWTRVAIDVGLLSQDLARKLIEEPAAVQTMAFRRMDPEDIGEESGILPAVERGLDRETVRKSRELRLGRLAIRSGLANEDHVEEALQIQVLLKELGIQKRVGEILVKKGRLDEPSLRRLLDQQRREQSAIRWSDLAGQLDPAPEDRETAQVLMARAHLSTDQIQECLYVQRAMREMGLVRSLRDVVVDKGILPLRTVEEVLARHEMTL